MRDVPRFRFVILWLPMLGSLLGCTQQRWWDEYASKTEMMIFLTFVPCDTFFVSGLPEHQMYFHVTSLSANADTSYRVGYQQQAQLAYERLYFLSVRYIGLRDYTAAISTVWRPSDTSARCAALVMLPWSSPSQRPFFYPVTSESRAAAQHSLEGAFNIDSLALLVLALLCLFARDGFLEGEREQEILCLVSFICVVVLNAGVYWFNSLALTNIDALRAYYDFYDALPTSGGHLLPLHWSQAVKLFDGPPHPASLIVNNNLSYVVLCFSCAVWLVLHVRQIFIGIAYATMTDPFEEMRARFAAEGRVPTPEDYINVLTQAGAGMSAWQLELLKREMKERSPDG
jgi:hypothetical protein